MYALPSDFPLVALQPRHGASISAALINFSSHSSMQCNFAARCGAFCEPCMQFSPGQPGIILGFSLNRRRKAQSFLFFLSAVKSPSAFTAACSAARLWWQPSQTAQAFLNAHVLVWVWSWKLQHKDFPQVQTCPAYDYCDSLGAGHSLGGFTAACSAIFFKDILRVTTFESPGLTSFYHSLARQEGSKEYWQQRVVNYLSVPNPINTCQRHLGLMIRWAARNLNRAVSPVPHG